eukprot:GFUD01122185.1.p1 GENE.GFUD01122185.1~~GFUD01122185.1.p1  ORF type:complete len:110 (+),score=18.78 GFUD01122185.1:283-612(+)
MGALFSCVLQCLGRAGYSQCCRCSNCLSCMEINIYQEMAKWSIRDFQTGKKGRCHNCGGTAFISCYQKDAAGQAKLKSVCGWIRYEMSFSGLITCLLPTADSGVRFVKE